VKYPMSTKNTVDNPELCYLLNLNSIAPKKIEDPKVAKDLAPPVLLLSQQLLHNS
jgi:hypothetical protein